MRLCEISEAVECLKKIIFVDENVPLENKDK